MEITNLSQQAFTTLDSLVEAFEKLDTIEVDYDGKILQICLPDGKQYLINFHGPSNQLWVSSPFSGAHHFEHKKGNWQSTRANIDLKSLLKLEFNNQIGYGVDL